MCVSRAQIRNLSGDFFVNCLARIDLPKSVANSLGNVVVPSGTGCHKKS